MTYITFNGSRSQMLDVSTRRMLICSMFRHTIVSLKLTKIFQINTLLVTKRAHKVLFCKYEHNITNNLLEH